MEILIGKNSGFCFGVKRAVDGVENDVKKYKKLNCLGEIVHNEVVVEKLQKLGVNFIDNISEAQNNSVLAIRAHGVDEKTYKEAENKNLEVIDYTCPKVKNIHEQIKKAYQDGYQIILVGKKTHPEVSGSSGYAQNTIVIEMVEEVEELPNFEKVFCIVQTTFSHSKYIEIENRLKEKYQNIKCVNSICPSTKNRQQECQELAQKVDFMIIIGGKNSSNTHKLYEVACKVNENCIIIQDENDKKIEESKKYGIIGIMSGASTPDETINKVVEKIRATC